MKCQDCFTTGYTWNKLICSCSLGQGLAEKMGVETVTYKGRTYFVWFVKKGK